MKRIDISIIEKRQTRTFLLFLNRIFDCALCPSKIVAERFIDTYIPDTKQYILRWTENDIDKIRDIQFETKAMKMYNIKLEEKFRKLEANKRKCDINDINDIVDAIQREKHKFDLNTVACNLCTLLIMIEDENKDNYELFEYIELQEYEEVRRILNEKVEGLILISCGVFNYIIDISKDDIDYTSHYHVAPDLHINIQQQRIIQAYKKYIPKEENHNCYVSDILLFFELIIVKHKIDIIKILLSLICICKSIEYDDTLRQYAKTLIYILLEVMYCGEVHKVYIQMKDTNICIPKEERGSNDATTRFSIMFSMCNEDILLLRIDLPHKGENRLHINLQECVQNTMLETGYPLKDTPQNRKKLKGLVGNNFDELFFYTNNHIWFRSEFVKKLKKVKLENENKELIMKLFRDRCHYSIDFAEEDEEKYIEFTNELRDYFVCLGLNGSIMSTFDKNSLNIEKEFWNVRKQQMMLKKLMRIYIEEQNCSVHGNELLWSIWGESEQFKNICKADFLKMDLSECWKFIDGIV